MYNKTIIRFGLINCFFFYANEFGFDLMLFTNSRFFLDKLLKLFKVINSIHLIIYANELGFVFVLECTITDKWLNNQM